MLPPNRKDPKSAMDMKFKSDRDTRTSSVKDFSLSIFTSEYSFLNRIALHLMTTINYFWSILTFILIIRRAATFYKYYLSFPLQFVVIISENLDLL